MAAVVGLVGAENAADMVVRVLKTLQRRGGDATGIASFSDGRLRLYKDVGNVDAVFDQPVLARLPGSAAIGQSQFGSSDDALNRNNAQPFITRRPSMALAIDGTVGAQDEVEAHLWSRGTMLVSASPAEPVLHVLADALLSQRPTEFVITDMVHACSQAVDRLGAGFAAVGLVEVEGQASLFAFRGLRGMHPLFYGRHPEGAWCVASESIALEVHGFEVRGEVPHGTLILLRRGASEFVQEIQSGPRRHCIVQDIALAHSDSWMLGARVAARRWRLGRQLGLRVVQRGISVDVVIAAPSLATPVARAVAETLGAPVVAGFRDTTHQVPEGRLDRHPAETVRRWQAIQANESVVRGRQVLVVTGLLLRGGTAREMVEQLRRCGVQSVHLAAVSPPVTHRCAFGVPMPPQAELIASGIVDAEIHIAETVGADSVTMLAVADLTTVAGEAICVACFSGVVRDP